MYQATPEVWNAIAASQPLSPYWAPLFRANPAEMGARLAALQTNAEKWLGLTDPKLLRSFLLVAPLLSENEAISAYLEESGRQDLRAALPEVCSVTEAVSLATAEYRLSTPQQTFLATALGRFLRKPALVLPSAPQTSAPQPTA
jgi:hypothetical protein